MFHGKNTTESPISSILKEKDNIDVEILEPVTNEDAGPFGRIGTEFGMYVRFGRTMYYFERWGSNGADVTFQSYVFADKKPTEEDIATAIEKTKDFRTCSV